jgi:hypothetical protein
VRFPDSVTLLRASGADEYGNAAASWEAPTPTTAQAFVIGGSKTGGPKAYLPTGSDAREGDRLLWRGGVYSVEAVKAARSPSRDVLVIVSLRRVEG